MKSFSTQLSISGMSCGHCVRSVDAALRKIEGVEDVEVRLAEGEALVRHTEAAPVAVLITAVVEEGYEAKMTESV